MDNPQLVDHTNNLTCIPGAPGDPFVDNFPRELIGTSAGKLYLYLRDIATGREGELLSLPGRRDLARSAGMSVHTLIDAEKFLHNKGWIQITNFKVKGQRTERRRIIVKHWVQETVRKLMVEEMYKLVQRGIDRTIGAVDETLLDIRCIHPQSPSVDIIYSSDPAAPVGEPGTPAASNSNLRQILRTCKKADRHGRTLAQYNEQTILGVCHDATQSDIAIAILEVERYSAKPSDILKLFAARFKDGKLNPERKGSFRVHSGTGGIDVHTAVTPAASLPVAISYDHFHTPEDVDSLCTSLNGRETVERGKIPIASIHEHSSIFIVDDDLGNPYVKLAGNVSLVRVAAGKWGIRWQISTRGAKGNTRAGRTESVAETLASDALSSSVHR